MRILIGNDRHKLLEALAKFSKSATIKTEFGESSVAGSVCNLSHYSKNDGIPPCLAENTIEQIDVIGIKRFDLDTLGGILSLQGKKACNESFWKLAAHAEINGTHSIPDLEDVSEKDIRRIYAYYAYASHHKIIAPEDGSVKDVTSLIEEHANTLDLIMRGDKSLMYDGKKFKKDEDILNKSSFIQENNGVITRVSSRFTNHLYRTPEGKVAKAVVAYNTSHGKITISFATSMDISAAKLAKDIWGDGAGGPNRTIAGSPKAQRMDLNSFTSAVDAVQNALGE